MNIQNRINLSFIKKLWWLFLLLSILEFTVIIYLLANPPKIEPTIIKNIENEITKSKAPECPDELSGILTYPFIRPQDISAITPLGNINPPGHTSPVDHNYFETDVLDEIPLYAPADSTITNMIELAYKESEEDEYVPTGYLISFLICDGLQLDITEYTKISERLQNEIQNITPECYGDIKKDGHDKIERQCHYNLGIKVQAGEILGSTQVVDGKFPFELWAANYNVAPRSDVNWNFYNDNRYAHIICLFDLYSGDLKDQYYAKFGTTRSGTFVPRTVEPLCGEVNQNINGTIQGMWYNGEQNEKDLEFQGKGLAFLHNNLDPTMAEISIGGTIKEKAEIKMFTPTHSGTINREPSEVTADGKIYCFAGEKDNGKVLVQLIAVNKMDVEYQIGKCDTSESFKSPYKYQR